MHWSNKRRSSFRSDKSATATCSRRRNKVVSAAALEALEIRRLLSGSAVVTSTSDNGTGTLRAAIAQAAADPTANDTFTITFASALAGKTITSASTLDLSNDTANVTIVIDASAAPGLTVKGGGSSSNYSVFTVSAGVTASITGLTITNGYNSDDDGGGIFNNGSLTVQNSTISGNFAEDFGGGVLNGGTMMLLDSTVSGNSSDENAGGIFNSGTLTVQNSTISGNTNFGAEDGGGITNDRSLTVLDSTITGNSVSEGNAGGGISTQFGSLTLEDSIVSNNTASTDPDIDGSITTDDGHNLLGTGVTAGPTDISSNTPRLGTLSNNGGPTDTMALLNGSPAIAAGTPIAGIDHDQRGVARNSKTPDIGAYEYTAGGSLVVDTTSDAADSIGNTLRDAIAYAATLSGPQTVTFASALTAGGPATIILTQAQINITSSLTITGPGANELTINGDLLGPDFTIDSTSQVVNITGLTLTNAQSSGNGAIYNNGDLTLSGDVLTGNSAVGVYNENILNSSGNTYSDNNDTNQTGGGISNYGTLTSINDTISGNTGLGGGIFTLGPAATITNDTITNNSAGTDEESGYGGGIFVDNGTVKIANTIVAGNTAAEGDADVDGSFTDEGNNLIGDGTGGNFTNGTKNDQVGTTAAPVKPLLGTLGNYGGPIPTVPLLPGSPAINAGSNSLAVNSSGKALTTDGRGTGYPRIVNSTVDIGAFESGGFTISVSGGNNQSATVSTQFANPLVATVAPKNAGEPVIGGVISFTAPASGASATLASKTETIGSNATVSDVATANSTAGGPYNVTASASGITTPATFALTNNAVGSLVVNTTSDATNPGPGLTTLRQAIAYANSLSGPQTVTFASALTSGGPATITLTNGELDITGSLTITGPGANELTIDGDNNSEIFVVNNQGQTTQDVAITGLTLTDAPGAIDDSENLTLGGDDISYNTGSGVTIESGATLTSSGDAFVGNVESQFGAGGISNYGTLYSSNDTFSGNSGPNGGGIYSEGTATLTNDTITENHAVESFPTTGYGGGVLVLTGTLTIANTIIAGNSADANYPDVSGRFTSSGHNLIGDGNGGSGFVASDQVGTDAMPINAMLGTLGNNGGPIPTVAELSGSPAINAGSNALAVDSSGKALTTDGRGTGYPRIVDGTVDIGAFEASIATPTANSQTVSVAHDTATAVTLSGSDSDKPPLALTYTVGTQPAHGTLTGTAPNLTYTPNAGYYGSDSFTFTDSNGTNSSGRALVTLKVAIGTPTATAQTVTVPFNTAKEITLAGTDDDTPSLTQSYAVASGPAHGTLSGTAPNLTYTPTAGYSGSDSFTFTESNGTNTSAPATISINVGLSPVASIAGIVYDDKDENDTYGGADPGLAGVTLNLYVTGASAPTATTTSSSNGSYAFTSVSPGTYTLTMLVPASYVGETPNVGTDGGAASYNSASSEETVSSISLSGGDSATGYNFGAYPVTTPSISGTPQPGTAVVGTSIADKATVTGNNPGGTVTFDLYSNATATGTPLFTDTETLSSGTATSASYTPTATGTDYWVATYNGDAKNSASNTADAAQPVAITPATPSITNTAQPSGVTLGASIADQASVTGGYQPGGSVTFNLYNNPTATGTPLFTDTETLSGGTATSASYTPAATGTDYWVATYNGDSDNNPVSTGDAAAPVVISPAAPTGTLAGSSATAATGYILNIVGTSDWAAYGVNGNAGSFDHKATGGSQISNISTVGTGSFGAYNDANRNLTWNDGTPQGTDSEEHGFAYINNGLNAGYTFTAPADTTSRILYIYLGGYSSGATLTAHLSGSSVADYVATYSSSGKYNELVEISYTGASANQKLIVTYLKTSNINGTGGSADLMAAWLGGPPPVTPVSTGPQVTTNPQSQSVTVGTDVQFTAAATGNPTPTVQWYVSTDGGKTFLGYAGGNTDTIDIGPAMLSYNGNEYEAIFTNSAGMATTSIATLTVTPVATAGGSLSGTSSTAAASYNLTALGTTDWAHFGTGGSATGYDHKATSGLPGGSQISNVTKVGTGSFGGYDDPNRNVSWTDGTPTAKDTGDEGYLYANNGIGAGYSFTAPADTTTRTIYVYVGGYSSGSTLTAHLSDGSAADYVTTFSSSGKYNDVVAITYKAASAGQKLVLTYVKSQNINGTGGSADLIAAWLA